MSITEVARRAGLSVATVSRVFNTPALVNEQTRSKVLRVAGEVGYVANASARTLRTRHSQVLGVVLPTLTNPVFAECLQGIASQAAQRGYAISPCTTEYDHGGEEEAVARLLASGVDGLVLVVSQPSDSAALARVRQAGKPYVLAYNRTEEHACVAVDNEGAVRALIARLAAAGHRRIAMVTGQLRASDRAQQRCRGYAQGMQAAGLQALPLWEVPFAATAVQLLQRHLAEHQGPAPTAIVCSNDLLALRTLRAAALAGLSVPADLSVVGFDGIALGADLTPSLASISQPNHEIGTACVTLLCDALAGKKTLSARDSLCLPHGWRGGESCRDLD
jgi:DNA-binding LacI/PurR family transcriptional regulator